MSTSQFSDVTPLRVIVRSLGLYLSGRVRYPRQRVGETLVREDGRRFTIFRELAIRPGKATPPPPTGIFRVWFHARTSVKVTQLYSWVASLLFIGMPGFRHKLYLVDEETGELGGIYTWETKADAHAYHDSYAMTLSARRSVPGAFRKEVTRRQGDTVTE